MKEHFEYSRVNDNGYLELISASAIHMEEVIVVGPEGLAMGYGKEGDAPISTQRIDRPFNVH
jgi:hypothetical protein